MKKIFFAMFALAALVLVGCEGKGVNVMDLDPTQLDNETEKCWVYTLTYAGVSADAYIWSTERLLVETIQETLKTSEAAGIKYTATYKESPADDSEKCIKKNISAQ